MADAPLTVTPVTTHYDALLAARYTWMMGGATGGALLLQFREQPKDLSPQDSVIKMRAEPASTTRSRANACSYSRAAIRSSPHARAIAACTAIISARRPHECALLSGSVLSILCRVRIVLARLATSRGFMSTAMENLRPRHRINVDEFFRVVESGVLGEDARVELIDGEIIDMEPIGIDHGWVVDELTAMFHSSLGNKVAVRTQGALRVDDWNFFLPDVTVLQGLRDRYRTRHPTVDDILLVIEVADSSLRKDMKIKRPIYLRHSAAEIWIVDVQKMVLHVQRASDGAPSPHAIALRPSTSVSLHALPGVEIDLSSLAPL